MYFVIISNKYGLIRNRIFYLLKFFRIFLLTCFRSANMRLTAGIHAKVLLVSRSPSTLICMVKSVSSNMGIISFNNASKIACSICLEVPSKFPLCTILEELLHCIEREFSIV